MLYTVSPLKTNLAIYVGDGTVVEIEAQIFSTRNDHDPDNQSSCIYQEDFVKVQYD